ncbi:MAG TPA: hypothetical protein VE842_16610 [Pyrinomonadaceae bacterium]|nr:hypothetical protein [Pyrinomonadaceae bacterium]
MAENKSKEQPELSNEISEETGQYDVRFLLWRQFCRENGVPVETLPGELEGKVKEKWESLKEARLGKPAK